MFGFNLYSVQSWGLSLIGVLVEDFDSKREPSTKKFRGVFEYLLDRFMFRDNKGWHLLEKGRHGGDPGSFGEDIVLAQQNKL